MGRDTTADNTPLLRNAEQNIGNSDIVNPEASGAAPNTGTIIPQTNPPRLLQLTGGSAAGQTTSVVFTASRIVGAQNPNPGFPGPLTGILEFGNGGRSTKVEFDVPIGPFLGSISQAAAASEPQDGGVIVTVPTGVLRAYVRYDNRLIAPVLGSNQSLAQIRAVPFTGPGGPRLSPPGADTPAEPVLAKAMAAYFSRHFARAYKSLYCYVSDTFAPTPIVIGDPVAGTYNFFCLPAFTRTVQVVRLNVVAPPPPTMPAMQIVLNNGIQNLEFVDLAAGVPSPVIPVSGHENIIGIRSTAPADTVTSLVLICEVGV